jgi:hypothetical protein
MSGAGWSGQPDKAVVVWEPDFGCFEEMPRRGHLHHNSLRERRHSPQSSRWALPRS